MKVLKSWAPLVALAVFSLPGVVRGEEVQVYNISGVPGSTVQDTLEWDDVGATAPAGVVIGFTAIIRTDASVLWPNASNPAEAGPDLPSGWTIVTRVSVNQETLVVIGYTGNSANGIPRNSNDKKFLLVNYDVLYVSLGTTSPIDIVSFTYSTHTHEGPYSPGTITGGTFTAALGSISGHIEYWNGGTDVEDATVTLSGAMYMVTSTNATGDYTFSGLNYGNYTITPSKTTDRNDVLDDITVFDVYHITANGSGYSGYQLTAGDVDNDGDADANDAAMVANFIAGGSSYGLTNTWVFDPTSRSVSGLAGSVTGQDFTAVLRGDASGNWDPLWVPGGGEEIPYHLQVTPDPQTGETQVVLNTPANAIFLALELPKGARVARVEPVGNALFAYHQEGTRLNIVYVSLTPVEGPFATIYWAEPPKGALQIKRLDLNDRIYKAEKGIQVSGNEIQLRPLLALHQGRITYTVPNPGLVELKVYDASGRMVYQTRKFHGSAGTFSTAVNLPEGVYFLTLSQGRLHLRSKAVQVR